MVNNKNKRINLLICVDKLQSGDYVDLEGDIFADPENDNSWYEYHYAIVDQIEHETPGCIRVDFQDGDSIGFPPDHILKIKRRVYKAS